MRLCEAFSKSFYHNWKKTHLLYHTLIPTSFQRSLLLLGTSHVIKHANVCRTVYRASQCCSASEVLEVTDYPREAWKKFPKSQCVLYRSICASNNGFLLEALLSRGQTELRPNCICFSLLLLNCICFSFRLPNCIHFSCCSPIVSASAAAPRIWLVKLMQGTLCFWTKYKLHIHML